MASRSNTHQTMLLSTTALRLISVIALTGAAAAQAPTVILSIQLNQPAAHAVSRTLYGLMTEEINHSYDGGL
jgi:alpha-N-arabinofuranosidase